MGRIPVPSKTIRGYQYVLENDFTGGLKTEFTGLNFPENACTSTENCTFFHTGAVFRRNGFNYELNNTSAAIDRTNVAMSTFVWTNAGGDGSTKILVNQIGSTLYFYQLTNATLTSPLSTTKLSSTVSLSSFVPAGGSPPDTSECQYASGNGYLFVYHPNLDPFYCTFSSGVVTGTSINIQVRDFTGIPENVLDVYRPLPVSITKTHLYNLQNQGWTSSAPWSATSASRVTMSLGPVSFNTQAGLPVVLGTAVTISMSITANAGGSGGTGTATGVVNFYGGNTMIVNISSFSPVNFNGPLAVFQALGIPFTISWVITPQQSGGQINTWVSAIGNYPSNADVWWSFKNSTGVFDPTTTINNVTLGSGPAPRGFYILSAFNQQRSTASGQTGLASVVTPKRPKTGTWFQGRVWYAGVDDSQITAGSTTSWSENIYFSQIVSKTEQFARCYQTNDPTSETLFDLLPSDGGVITIQGSGSIYKLFPLTNGLLVFAANGVWFITGSQGIGFTATDYTITKLSAIQSISSTSYVDVLGYPMFWNEEGIYTVGVQSEQQGISINSVTLKTIKQFYDAIPLQSKKFARGAYNPVTGQVQWLYRSTNETDITSRYNFDSVLNLSMFTQAFYPWSVSGVSNIHDVTYVVGPGGSTSPLPTFKYLTSTANTDITFSEERDNVLWKDWTSTDYLSFFITGYRLHGDAQRKFQPMYIFMYSDNAQNTAYKFNGKWNFALSGNSGKVSTEQVITNTISPNNFSKLYRRHRLRGRGTVLQLQIASVSGKPFHIDGWALTETQSEKP